MSFLIGEGLAGDGNEIAHIDILIGKKDSPVGTAFANALARQSEGHTNLLAVLTPNVLAKPATVTITKVTIKGMKQAVQMFGPAQSAVAWAVTDARRAKLFESLGKSDDIVIVCGVFIHPAAESDEKIFRYNYTATKMAIEAALKNGPSDADIDAAVETLGKEKSTIDHPFKGKFDLKTVLEELRTTTA